MNEAKPIKCYVPSLVQKIDGVLWMQVPSDGTLKSYKEMPNGLAFQGTEYAKMSWNSDTNTVTYKQAPLAKPA